MAQNLDELVKKVKAAHERYKDYTQEQVDKIVVAVAIAADRNRLHLARIAIEETQMGVFEDKVIKVRFAAEHVLNKYRDEKTCGVIERDRLLGIHKIADSMGVVAAVIPCTNPTSTIVFKTLLALKTRNSIVFAPHPKSKKCSVETAKILLAAAVAAGAPEDVIGCIEEPTIEGTQQLMHHADVAVILATGGPGLVKAAYSSGKPAIGVGPGNAPAIIDETADIPMAVNSIMVSKTFDNGMICASEQSIVAVEPIYEQLKKELALRDAYILSESERKKLAAFMIINGALNPKIVGQSAQKIAQMAGIKIPQHAKVLIAEVKEVGVTEPFSYEKLSPILGLYCEKDFNAAVAKAEKLIEFGGLGHTSCLYTNENNKERMEYVGTVLKTVRVLVNMPSALGAIGDIYNFYLEPSLTLGCGTYGGNIISGNIGVKHLLNIKILAERRENMMWFRIPPQIYFKYGCLPAAILNLKEYKKVFIVSDRQTFKTRYLEDITNTLESMDIKFEVFADAENDPDLATIEKCLGEARECKPDVIIAVGGGISIGIAKVAWLMYDHPEISFADLAMRFMDIKKRVHSTVSTKKRTFFVAVPTTSGAGTEVTPYTVISDKGVKYAIADHEITPDMVIADPSLVQHMPQVLVADTGFDAITHAIEAFVAITATDFTNALAKEALRILFKYLPISYRSGENNFEARERVHYAATMAGMSYANAYLGICHSLTHKLSAAFNISHGTANAIMIPHVIRFNATDSPNKFPVFPQYRIPLALSRYAKIADGLQLDGKNEEEKVELLIKKLEGIRKELGLPASIKELGVPEKDFMAKVDELAELAFDDQCTGANPRYPLVSELRELYIKAYHG